ncbi:ATPase, partial [Rhizobium hidalgonense]|nr:ATPase [Rhizobium hidalgonense]
IWQWWINRDNPRARAALRWFAACILVSCGLFVFLVQTSQLLDINLNLSQGYALGFFLLVTIGIALGLKRYRLFDLDQWAFGILFWLGGAIVLVALDAVLIMLLSPVMSLGVALLICGLIWLPLRGILQRHFFIKPQFKQEDLFQAVL